MDREIALFIEDYLAELDAGNAAIFAGAGLSVPAGFVDWRELLRPLAKELNLDVNLEPDLVAVAQFHVNANGANRHRLHTAIIEALSIDGRPTLNHQLLARLPVATWWTTNYDKLIETALKASGKIVDVKSAVPQLATTRPRRDAIVYKMHGDVERPDEAVATRDDYENYPKHRGAFTNALAGDLISKTFLFVGFSFSDPNLEQVLARVRTTFEKNQRRHFAIFRARAKQQDETEDAFQNAKIRQALVFEDLKRFNIKAIVVNEYDEITEIFRHLESRYRRKTVFVSSAAHTFEPWGKDAVEQFMRALGTALVNSNLKIATGLGLGVGNALLTGAIEEVLRTHKTHIEDTLTIRPFPVHIPDKELRSAAWGKYRNEVISTAGVAIFLFGNKIENGEIVISDGMLQEFDIGKKHGLILLPIGATGYAAKQLFEKELAHSGGSQKAVQDELVQLANPAQDLTSLISPIVRIILSLKENN